MGKFQRGRSISNRLSAKLAIRFPRDQRVPLCLPGSFALFNSTRDPIERRLRTIIPPSRGAITLHNSATFCGDARNQFAKAFLLRSNGNFRGTCCAERDYCLSQLRLSHGVVDNTVRPPSLTLCTQISSICFRNTVLSPTFSVLSANCRTLPSRCAFTSTPLLFLLSLNFHIRKVASPTII